MKYLLPFLFLFICSSLYAQPAAWEAYLNRDLSVVLRDKIDSLNLQLEHTEDNLRNTEASLRYSRSQAGASVDFIFLLHKLESRLPLNNVDSAMIINCAALPDVPAPSDSAICLLVWDGALQLLNTNMSPGQPPSFLNTFPRLKDMYSRQLLSIQAEEHNMASAPAIVFPPMPSLVAGRAPQTEKKRVADLWLNYIKTIATQADYPETELRKYFDAERTRVPAGNLDKLIEFRQKFALFIIDNHTPHQ